LCGIAGFTHSNRAVHPGRIQSAVATLVHRGPNQQGVFESELVSLGATRLRIIDTTSGDQPVVSENRDTVIVFNGEIYNHAELRRELEQRGHRFRSRSDTETVLNAFLANPAAGWSSLEIAWASSRSTSLAAAGMFISARS
jgi:asparagine synthase (glutamine-hydrolysing)